MLFTEEIYFKNDFYTVLLREADNLLMEVVREHKPIWKSYSGDVIASYDLQNYMLTLQDLILDKHLMKDNEKFYDREPSVDLITGSKVFDKLNCPVKYTGHIIVAKDIVDTFSYDGDQAEYPCFCYKEVYELCFEQGALVTSIDHSKAMVRIRKNIEKGLRNVKNTKDIRCINRFLKQTFCHDFERNRKLRKLKNKVYRVKRKVYGE